MNDDVGFHMEVENARTVLWLVLVELQTVFFGAFDSLLANESTTQNTEREKEKNGMAKTKTEMNNEYCFCFHSLMLFYRPSFLFDIFFSSRYTVLQIPIAFFKYALCLIFEKGTNN